MKKTIPKPVNWQDFESLCKMLWGEMWEISDKIKKNGRLGQPQSGVDIYGVPKGKVNYHAIQCKGKDDYTSAKITKEEINKEIEKAKLFSPKIECLIFATTANKDAFIEQYIREKDIESRTKGGFEILIHCWEDIADLIETNRNTFNYYVSQNQFKSNFDLDVLFSNDSSVHTIQPTLKKIVTTHKVKRKILIDGKEISDSLFGLHQMKSLGLGLPMRKVNYSWATFTISITNTGNEVIEDYKLYITPEEGAFKDLRGYLGGLNEKINYYKNSLVYVFEKEKYAVFASKENSPLIQKDGRSFDLHILIKPDSKEVKLKYELLARNFDKKGELTLKVDPKFEVEKRIVWVEEQIEIKEEETVIDYDFREEPDSLFS